MVAHDHNNAKGDELPNQYNSNINKSEVCGYNNSTLIAPCLKEQRKCINNIATRMIQPNNRQLITVKGCEDSEEKQGKSKDFI